MLRIGLIAVFWAVTTVAFLRPTQRYRSLFLIVFFGLLIPCGLSHRSVWPFFSWDMWDRVQPAWADWWELSLVDTAGREWRYDFAAVPPAGAPAFETTCGRVLLEHPDRAASLAVWLLERARTLRESPADIRPQWWTTEVGFLPVGPAPREEFARWSREPGARPAEFVSLVARRRRIRFSTRQAAARQETIEERRFPWTGS